MAYLCKTDLLLFQGKSGQFVLLSDCYTVKQKGNIKRHVFDLKGGCTVIYD